MATRAAMAARDSDVQKRLVRAVDTLAGAFGVEPAPPFPPVRDPAYRVIDEREQLTMTLERIVAAMNSQEKRYA